MEQQAHQDPNPLLSSSSTNEATNPLPSTPADSPKAHWPPNTTQEAANYVETSHSSYDSKTYYQSNSKHKRCLQSSTSTQTQQCTYLRSLVRVYLRIFLGILRQTQTMHHYSLLRQIP